MRKIRNVELGRLSADEYRSSDKSSVVVVLDNVRSLNNIGSVFRSSDAFRCRKLILCGITAKPPHRDIHKTALGAEDTVPWEYFTTAAEAVNYLKEKGYRIIAVEQTDKSYPLNEFKAKPDEPIAFVFGHEIDGVSDSALTLADESLEIPQFGTKHSINISVCAGIVLWHHLQAIGKY
ncbi:MAG: RNA methyltransferase [Bacteroidota bacterium]